MQWILFIYKCLLPTIAIKPNYISKENYPLTGNKPILNRKTMNTACLLNCLTRNLPWYLVWSAVFILGLIVALTGGTVIILGVVVSALVAVLAISTTWAAGIAIGLIACYKKNCR